MENWYTVTKEQIHRLSGSGLLRKHYDDSPSKALQSIFPRHHWLPWKFGVTSARFWDDASNHKLYFEWLGRELQYSTMEDWYGVTKHDIHSHQGSGLLADHYGDSPSRALQAVFTSHSWHLWRFGVTSHNFWSDKTNQRMYFDWLGNQLQYFAMEDWYSVTQQHIYSMHGTGLLKEYYEDSPAKAVRAVFPEHPWLMWKFAVTIGGFWDDHANHRRYFQWLGEQLKHMSMDDWYKVTTQNIVGHHGGLLLAEYYCGSPAKAVTRSFPEHPWLLWKFGAGVRGFWEEKGNRKTYFEWLGRQLGYTELDHWYKLTQQQLFDNDGSHVLHSYNNCVSLALQELFPEHPWLVWKFAQPQTGFWDDLSNQKLYFKWLGAKLKYSSMEHWYNVSKELLQHNHGTSLLTKHDGSPSRALAAAFPEHVWQAWRFQTVPRGWWLNEANKQECFDWLCLQFGVDSPEDWSKVNRLSIKRLGCGKLLPKFGISLGKKDFPRYGRVFPIKNSGQHQLQRALHQLGFIGLVTEHKIQPTHHHHHHHHLQQHRHNQKKAWSLDVYVPSHRLAFEYQGQQHYCSYPGFPFLDHSLARRRETDLQKRQLCSDLGITLITIPYWWDRSATSLAATIRVNRPDLATNLDHQAGSPIAAGYDKDDQAENLFIVGNHWRAGLQDPTGWWASSRYDGVRAWWDGDLFWTKLNIVVPARREFVEAFPEGTVIDGCLFAGHGLEAWCQSAVIDPTTPLSTWLKRISYIVLDVPLISAHYEQRMEYARQRIGRSATTIKLAPLILCKGYDHLFEVFSNSGAEGGGLMLRSPGSVYRSDRSSSLLKVNNLLVDIGRVTRVDTSNNTLYCTNSCGRYFSVSMRDGDCSKVPLHSVIRYYHFGFGFNAVPRHAQFRGVVECKWQQVVPYSISYHIAPNVACRGCKRMILPHRVRVIVVGIRFNSTTHEEARQIKYHFCASVECILEGNADDKKRQQICYPPFGNQILLTT